MANRPQMQQPWDTISLCREIVKGLDMSRSTHRSMTSFVMGPKTIERDKNILNQTTTSPLPPKTDPNYIEVGGRCQFHLKGEGLRSDSGAFAHRPVPGRFAPFAPVIPRPETGRGAFAAQAQRSIPHRTGSTWPPRAGQTCEIQQTNGLPGLLPDEPLFQSCSLRFSKRSVPQIVTGIRLSPKHDERTEGL